MSLTAICSGFVLPWLLRRRIPLSFSSGIPPQTGDLLVTIPANGGLFPILALGEGSTLQMGFLLATSGAEKPKPGLGIRGQRMMGGLDNTLRSSVLRRKSRCLKGLFSGLCRLFRAAT
jgi:hypothetical protein